MALLMATIRGQLVRPDLGQGKMTVTIEASTEGSRLTYAGMQIAGKIPVTIASDGTASVTIPQTGQAGLAPSGATWRLIQRISGQPTYVQNFVLTGDTTWDAIIATSNVVVTSSLVSDAQAARDAAIAAAASVAVSTWQPSTAVVANQVVKAPSPDGSEISSNSSRTTRATFDATEQTFWTPVVTKAGTMATVALASAGTATYTPTAPNIGVRSDAFILRQSSEGDQRAALNAFLADTNIKGRKRIVGYAQVSDVVTVPAGVWVDAENATIEQTGTSKAAFAMGAGARFIGGRLIGKTTDYVAHTGSFTPTSNGINVTGAGAVIENVEMVGFANAGVYSTAANVRINGLRVTGVHGLGGVTIASGDAACYGVWAESPSSGMEVEDLMVENTSLGFINAFDCSDVLLRHINLRNIIGQHGIYVQNATGLTVEDVSGHDIALNLFKLQINPVPTTADMHGCRITGVNGRNVGDCVLIAYNPAADLTSEHRYVGVNIADVHGDSAARVLYIGSMRGAQISNVTANNTVGAVVSVLDCQDTTILGVESYISGREAVTFLTTTGSSTQRVTVRGVKAFNPGELAEVGTAFGVTVSGTGGYLGTDGQHVTIDGLEVVSNSGNLKAGIQVGASAAQETLRVRNAVCRGYNSAPFQLASNLRTVGEWSNIETLGNVTNFPYSFPIRVGSTSTKTRWSQNSLPVSGVFQVGDIIENSAPAAAGTPGWVCTTAGGLHNGTWAATTAYTVGQWRRTSTNKILECAVAGTSGGTEPNPATVGNAVADGTVTWVYRASAVAVVKAMASVAA